MRARLRTPDTQKRQPFILLGVTEPKQASAEEQEALPTMRERKCFFSLLPGPGVLRAQALSIISFQSLPAKGGHAWCEAELFKV